MHTRGAGLDYQCGGLQLKNSTRCCWDKAVEFEGIEILGEDELTRRGGSLPTRNSFIWLLMGYALSDRVISRWI
jgi:hypothetical protein